MNSDEARPTTMRLPAALRRIVGPGAILVNTARGSIVAPDMLAGLR